MNRGILEALAIQIPEIAKKELPDVAIHLAGLRPMREAFVESIVWRDPTSFTEATNLYIQKEILMYGGPLKISGMPSIFSRFPRKSSVKCHSLA